MNRTLIILNDNFIKMKKDEIKHEFIELKKESGTHSPSIATIVEKLPNVKIDVDACFLSNPYATDLFLKYLNEDLIKTNKLRDVLEFYPPQNQDVSRFISKAIGANQKNIFVGNGAIEIIQAVIHRFVGKKLCIIIPTFSSYYEFVRPDTEVVYYKLSKEDNFILRPEKFISFVQDNGVDSIAIINPNNPNGGYLSLEDLNYIIESLRNLNNIIIDESFIHFAYENVDLLQITSEELIKKYSNLIIVKSLSKDFGIAGVRAGYALMSEDKVSTLLSNGYLWNVSGLADYFFKIYSQSDFIQEYNIVRKKYIMNTLMFLTELNSIHNLKVYPSRANFALIELNDRSSFDFYINLLVDSGVYVRDCSDKIGLEGQFVRIASRTFEENLKIISAVRKAIV
jgi:histidinol-phosphate/aromatic aminotransferase/cobyric acid decarboxylase-like protein